MEEHWESSIGAVFHPLEKIHMFELTIKNNSLISNICFALNLHDENFHF